jgi:hypothetical protein
LFGIKASGPTNLKSVEYFIDSTSIGIATESPYKIQFSTDNYGLGTHTIHAVGTTTDGQQLISNEYTREFVSASESWDAGLKIAGPMFGLLLVVIIFAVVLPLVLDRNKKPVPLGYEHKYGVSGGAICPKCQRPFALRFFSLNMGLSKLDRCPNCGKWSIVRAKPLGELRAAEAAELARSNEGGQIAELSPEEKLRQQLDNSRYQDS